MFYLSNFFLLRFKFIFILLFLFSNFIFAQGNGKITGKLVDSNTGDPLIGANVFLENTTLGAATDLDGYYMILTVPEGTYTLTTMMIGYAETKVQNVEVKSGEVISIDLALNSEILSTDEVVVEAKALTNTEAALLGKRQKSVSVSDAISAEAISRSGSNDAASAMQVVTGASVVDGKYVYIRGLGERYSSTHLNGAELPSADPDKKAFQMDLFPSNLLDNIETLKTFTPDKPGNFSGGIVDIGTKNFPENFTLKFSTSTSFNSKTTFNDDYITHSGGDLDWLGFDDGTRSIPDELKNVSQSEIPNIAAATTNPEKAQLLDKYSKVFNNVMAPKAGTAPLDQSYSFSIGNQIELWGRPLGFISSVSYGRKYSFYDNGIMGLWNSPGSSGGDFLNNNWQLNESKGVAETSLSGLFNMSYKISSNHEVSYNLMYARNGESTSRYMVGSFPESLEPSDVYETRVLKYVERDLLSYQFKGKHHLNDLGKSNIEWNASFALTRQDEPDLRFFSNHYVVNGNDIDYYIKPSNYNKPTRYYRDMDEWNFSTDLKFTIPFNILNRTAKFSFGGLVNHKERTYTERIFRIYNQSFNDYTGDPLDYFSNNMGIISENTNGTFSFGNYVEDVSELRSNYNGTKDIFGTFAMVDMMTIKNLRLILGARFERTDINVETEDPSYEAGKIEKNDILPSVNLIYNFTEKMNLRLAYTKTLARPNMRELAPFPSYDFNGGFYFIGNPELTRTLITNYDFRYEWFVNPGEIFAVSGFYKSFENPIEKVIKNVNGEIQYQNVDNAYITGLELEIRKHLGSFTSYLNDFLLGSNLSLVYSEVKISPDELAVIRSIKPNADNTRQLQGQSPYLFNAYIQYQPSEGNTSFGLFYNIFGKRISEVSLGGAPNVYEQPFESLNATFSQGIWENLKVKLSAKNILNDKVSKEQKLGNNTYISTQYNYGRTYSVGLSYEI